MCVLFDYSSPTSIKDFLKSNNFAMQKKWGQNFLIDPKMRENVIEMLGNIEGMNVWEVGPGLGAMTHLLLKKNVSLKLFEIDAGFISFLRQFFERKEVHEKAIYKEVQQKDACIEIVEGNVLKTWKTEVKKAGLPDILFGCLPYNISIELLLAFFKKGAIFDRMLITVQKEVSQKMLAKENTKEYAPMSVFTNYFYECRKTLDIPPSSFWPQPKVTSTAILLTKKETLPCNDVSLFILLVSALFTSKRRTIKNNLNAMLTQHKLWSVRLDDALNDIEDFFDSLNIPSSLRAENLRVEDFVAIANKLQHFLN